jgi:hypothetical protein
MVEALLFTGSVEVLVGLAQPRALQVDVLHPMSGTRSAFLELGSPNLTTQRFETQVGNSSRFLLLSLGGKENRSQSRLSHSTQAVRHCLSVHKYHFREQQSLWKESFLYIASFLLHSFGIASHYIYLRHIKCHHSLSASLVEWIAVSQSNYSSSQKIIAVIVLPQ